MRCGSDDGGVGRAARAVQRWGDGRVVAKVRKVRNPSFVLADVEYNTQGIIGSDTANSTNFCEIGRWWGKLGAAQGEANEMQTC